MSPGGVLIRPATRLAAIAVASMLLTACVQAAEPAVDAQGPAATTSVAEGVLLDLTPAEALAHVDAQQGAPVVINVWASWCPPCRDEAPTLSAAARRFEDSVTFLGINFQDSRDGASRFVDTFDWPFASIYDERGDVARALGLSGIPVTLVLDAQGDEVYRHVGSISETRLLAALEAAM